MASPRFVIGIDLGTTNCAFAFAEIERARALGPKAVEVFAVDQLVAAGECAPRSMLPSSLYLPGDHELPAGALSVPWNTDADYAVGHFAQERGSKIPGRLVTSAKSWLSYGGVDRDAEILPWGGDDGVAKVSPVTASARYLEHMAAAWAQRFPNDPMADQDIVLTVPASFDDAARTLTLEAAQRAGLGDGIVLLEEPQAAFYEHFAVAGPSADRSSRLVLVVDVGGGTTDFTLIEVSWADGEEAPTIKRLAVGDHILLGGDNMDLTLAHLAESRLSTGGRLDAGRMAALVQGCRRAKEVLLGDPDEAPETYGVTLPGRGRKLVGGSKSCELSRVEVESLILDGFLGDVAADARPATARRSALSAWGLPYASDPAITKHVAAFLTRHGKGAPLRPDAVLLNGGVFKSPAIRRRLVDAMGQWRSDDDPLDVLCPASFDLAVARGAATYGLVRHGIGHRIGGGAARAYFVGVHQAPGKKKKKSAPQVRRGVCLLPRHVEPGVEVLLSGRVFKLVLGRPVRFSLYATTMDRAEKPGELVDLEGDEFVALPPIQTVLQTQEDITDLPVMLRARLSDVGVLEVYADAVDREARYRLEFSLRDVAAQEGEERAETPPAPRDPLTPKARADIEGLVRRTYGKASRDADPTEIRRMRKVLETAVGKPRDGWTVPELRAVWDLLKPGMRRRRRSERHEATFFHLSGYCLRPGVGDPFDEWRVGELWSMFDPGVHFLKEAQVWDAWWIMWRRLAGGLDEAAQKAILEVLEPWLRPGPGHKNRKKPKYQGEAEALRLVGALERLPVSTKTDWGDWFLGRIVDGESSGRPAWCLARLGARQPLYGSSHQVVGPHKAEAWLEALLALDWRRTHNAALAAANLARCTGDRTRDVDPRVRETVAQRLTDVPALAHLAQSVREVMALERKDASRVFGESLPEGLELAE